MFILDYNNLIKNKLKQIIKILIVLEINRVHLLKEKIWVSENDILHLFIYLFFFQ
jgi:hypothetical protein